MRCMWKILYRIFLRPWTAKKSCPVLFDGCLRPLVRSIVKTALLVILTTQPDVVISQPPPPPPPPSCVRRSRPRGSINGSFGRNKSVVTSITCGEAKLRRVSQPAAGILTVAVLGWRRGGTGLQFCASQPPTLLATYELLVPSWKVKSEQNMSRTMRPLT